MKKIISLSLDEELIKKVDKKRGQVTRSTYVNTALTEFLDKGTV